MSAQEQNDFKLALKLQQQEMESRSEYETSPCSEPITTLRVNNELDLKFTLKCFVVLDYLWCECLSCV